MDQKALHLALITDDHFRAEAVEQIVKSLQWHVDSCVAQPNPLQWVRRQRMDLLLVDLDLPSAIAKLGELAQAAPNVPILALATPQHLVDLQDALLAGAASFIAFPIDVNQFVSTVTRTVQLAVPNDFRDESRGKIVAVVGLKGGVGRSTLAVNLAVALRQLHRNEIVLVEAHHGLGDMPLMLNLLPRHTVAGLNSETEIDSDLIQGMLQVHSSGIRLLAAPPDVSQLVELPGEVWRHSLQLLADMADFVVVDTAAAADQVLSEVLTLADEILIVTGPDLAGLRSAMVLLNSLEDERNVTAAIHVVLNRSGVRGGLSESASSDQLGEDILAAIPDDPSLATFAMNRGVPFVLSHPRSMLSRKVQELTEQLFAPVQSARNGKAGSKFLPFLARS